MKRYLIYILLIIPFLSSCVSDDCSDCADMAYDTRVKLQVTWPNELSPTNSKADAELAISDFTLFVFNANGTINTIKKVSSPGFTDPNRPATVSVNMNITSTAKYIYAIANCSDLLANTVSSHIATGVNANLSTLQSYFDNTLAVDYINIFESTRLVHTGFTDVITQNGTNPYNYIATVRLKPIVSKLDIIVKTETINPPLTPTDYTTCIESIEAFVLNSRTKAKLFLLPPPTVTVPVTPPHGEANITSSYMHGAYEGFWVPYGSLNFDFSDVNNTNAGIRGNVALNSIATPLSLYIPENDISLAPANNKTLVVLKVKYKMKSIEGTDEVFYRFLTVPLNPTGSNLSNKRGTKYTVTFNLSGKVFGAMSPLSSMMQPYSPTPTKTTKDLIYVEPEMYSDIKVSEWK